MKAELISSVYTRYINIIGLRKAEMKREVAARTKPLNLIKFSSSYDLQRPKQKKEIKKESKNKLERKTGEREKTNKNFEEILT